MERIARALPLVLALAGSSGCAFPSPRAALPKGPYVAVLSGQMPRPIDRVARHSWIVVHHADGHNDRLEMGNGGQDPFADFAAGDVMVHGVVEGSEAEIERYLVCVRESHGRYDTRHPSYFPIPGPNSNTIVAEMDRDCHLGIEMPATAIGRDYVGPIGVDFTEGRTGVELGSIPFGLRLGLREGVEAHFFGLPVGVHFWPPGINVPVNPGRLGFALDEHEYRRPRGARDDYEGTRPRVAAADAALFVRGSALIDRGRADDLAGEAVLGASAHGVYGEGLAYAFGIEGEGGASFPAGFAYSAHLFPAGLGYTLPATGYIAVFTGFGASGVTARVPSGLDLPVELRLAFDLGMFARLDLHARETFVALEERRRRGAGGLGEASFGVTARVGETRSDYRLATGSGFFFGFERTEIMDTAMVSFVFGTALGIGSSRR